VELENGRTCAGLLRAAGKRRIDLFVWDVSPTLFKVGPLEIRYYGLIFAAMILGGFYVWRWQMRRGGHPDATAERFALLGLVAVVLGSRLGHVLFYEPGPYLDNPLRILYLWEGGLASHGAAAGLTAALFYFARRERLPLVEVLDRFSMSAAIGAFSVRIGNFLNSEIVGRKTDVPWAVKFPRSLFDHSLPLEQVPARHPSQIYEVLLGIGVLLALYLTDRKLKEDRPLGLLAGLFLLLYFLGRFFVEFFKEFETLSPETSPLTMGQYLSIPFILLGAWLLYRTLKANTPTSTLRPVPSRAGRGEKKRRSKETAA
jgi:phosphatidylglycerol---prolipoprotein diacylglyceryl transferase